MDGTKHYSDTDLHYIENHPSIKANDIGSRLPYYLQYVRDGKINVKPEEEMDVGISTNLT